MMLETKYIEKGYFHTNIRCQFVLIIGLLSVSLCWIRPLFSEEAKSFPHIDAPTKYDLGEVKPFQEIRRTIPIKNIGGADLIIRHIEATRFCSAYPLFDGPILPKRIGKLQITLVPSQSRGKMNEELIIVSNDPKNPRNKIHIYGTIKVRTSVPSIHDATVPKVSNRRKRKDGDALECGLRFVKPSVDLGNVEVGMEISRTFQLENRGTKAIEIRSVRTSCACTASSVKTTKILPEQMGSIKVKIIVESPGKRSHSVDIFTEESSAMPACRLTITLTGVRTFSFSPSYIFFARIEKNKPLAVSKVVEISWPSKRGITISDITTSADFLCWQQINRYVNGGMAISKIKVIADPQKAPIGIFYEKVFVTTSGLFRPVIEIPVRGEIAGNIIVSPRRIFFGLVKKGKTVSRKIKLEIASSEEAQITGINTNSKFLSAKILPQKKSNICEAAVSLDKTHGIGRIDARVRIQTTDAYQPIIEVPVYGLVIE